MKVSETGEFGLIERLGELVGEPPEGEVWVGDDTAVLRAPAGTILFTADLLVEGVHFDLSLSKARDIGYKAIAVNVSDIAAMAGTPRRALVSIGIKPGIDVAWLEELYAGMRECSDAFGMAVVGGDISRSQCLFLSVALLGNPAGRRYVERGGAREGDTVCVTGRLGASAAGLRLMRAGNRDRPDLIAAHTRPQARVKEVEVLRRFLPSSMIDVSDGFAADLGHICDASEVGVSIQAERLPLANLEGVDLDRDVMELALHGGEDYELIFTIDPGRAAEAAENVESATGTRVSLVGSIVASDEGRWIEVGGERRVLEGAGWDHLKS